MHIVCIAWKLKSQPKKIQLFKSVPWVNKYPTRHNALFMETQLPYFSHF